MRLLLSAFALAFCLFAPMSARAVDAPPGQIQIDDQKLLRGHFSQDHILSASQPPVQSEGQFVLTPAKGLIWGIEKPFPTSTIVTENGAYQAIGGFVMKLPAKNLRHLYDMVAGALAGDWNKLAEDFDIVQSGTTTHWQMLLTPRHSDKPTLSYSSIKVTGGKFVDAITMEKSDGSNDTLKFSNVVSGPNQLSPAETSAFAQAK